MTINTNKMSQRLRDRSVDGDGKRILISRISDSRQSDDLSAPAVGAGFGRLRHFRRETSAGWPSNPLPIDPAAAALGLDRDIEELTAFVFQNAACNWRCWYCYVPFEMLAADEKRSEWLSAETMIDLFEGTSPRPAMLDLSGGQPDLVPEWTAWTLDELRLRGLDRSTYVWIDDNLSNDYYWRQLSGDQRSRIREYPLLGRVGCFKGFDPRSFAFNTGAEPQLFRQQFDLMARHISEGTDCYGYVTLTTDSSEDPSARIADFVDQLQSVHINLPLRVVPLEVTVWGPVVNRLRPAHEIAMRQQLDAVAAWIAELDQRFEPETRALPISQVRIW